MRQPGEDPPPGGLSDHLVFEALLADICASFVGVEADRIDGAIFEAQRRLCAFLHMDRSGVWQVSAAEPDVCRQTHLFRAIPGPAVPKAPSAADYFPWSLREIFKGRTLAVTNLSTLPPEAARDRECFEYYGTRSYLAVPIQTEGIVTGFVAFSADKPCSEWPQEIVTRCRLIAGVFASALARKRSEEALRGSEHRYRTLFESAPVGIVWIGTDGCVKAANPEQARMYGYGSPDALLGYYAPLFVAEKDRALASHNLSEQLRGVEVPPRQYTLVRRDGSEFIGEVTAGLLRGPHQEVQGYLCATRDITALVKAQQDLSLTVEELNRLKEQLQHENVYLRNEVQALQGSMPLVGNSSALKKVIVQAQQVAPTDSTVLVLGETGTGKELLASYIHRIGKRSKKPFIVANIAAIPATLLENELFGREKGAYTGAINRQLGRFELANGGILFLDEIGELPMETQVKLLRVLQNGTFERLGSSQPIKVDVQLIAATNRKLPELIKAGTFRQDLYYRLNVFPITLPPLRDRADDIPLLVWAFIKEFSEKMGKPIERIRKKDIDALAGFPWPGNVRELRNVIERSVILTHGLELHVAMTDTEPDTDDLEAQLLVDVQRRHIQRILKRVNGRIRGPKGAAQILGINPTTLYSLMERLGIERRTSLD